MTESVHILIVDDEANIRKVLAAQLEQAGFATSEAADAEEAMARVRELDPDLVLTDLKMPGADGLELLSRLRASFPEIPVVMLTAHGTIDAAVEAMRRGAHDFLTKPFDRDRVLDTIDRAVAQAAASRREFHGPIAESARCGIVGGSPAMEELLRMIERVAPSSASVLVTGETGTGKELVARAIHELSPLRGGPLVSINCGAIPEGLVESELFGHERGAFTGADQARAGRFELADGGTLFLDEIGEMPLAAQVKLLRVVEDGRVRRLGATEPRMVDVRLVAATNRDLATAVAEGRFREDLLYRLRVVEITIPPLRDRREDIPLLIEFFLDTRAARLGRPRRAVTDDAMAELASRAWPGNVRELENAVERALLLSSADPLDTAAFGSLGTAAGADAARAGEDAVAAADAAASPGASTSPGSRANASAPRASGTDLKAASRSVAARAERRLIGEALGATGGNITHAAERLGLSRRGLQLKMKDLGLR